MFLKIAQKKLTHAFALILASAAFSQATAQDCSTSTLDFSGTLSSAIDGCGNNGGIAVTINGGVAPYSYSIDDVHSSLSGSANLSSNSVQHGIFPGTWESTVTDANGCAVTKRFSIYSSTLEIEPLQCIANGAGREVRFSNNSSFIPTQVNINGFGISVGLGASVTVGIATGTYSATVTRGGCSYDVSFTVEGCAPTANAAGTPEVLQLETIDQLDLADIETSETSFNTAKSAIFALEDQFAEVTIFPNPTSDYFTVTLPEASKSEAVKVLVYDLQGAIVLESSVNGSGQTVDLETLDAGSYMIQLIGQNDAWSATKKIVKK